MSTLRRPESDGNGKTTLEKRGKNPPDVTLDHIVKDLLSFFSIFECLHEAKKEIQKKYDIKKQHGHYCWSADDIKQAWGKTQRMGKKSSRRKNWTLVIMVQLIKRYICDQCKGNAAQEESGVVSESQPTMSGRDEAPSPTEVNSIANSNNMKENPAGRSSQSNAELQTAEGGAVSSGNKGEGTNHRANKESERPLSTPSERDDKEDVPNWIEDGCSNKSNPQTVYIRIPLSVMAGDASKCKPERVQNDRPNYKLIDRVPNLTEIMKKKSYALLYDNRTRNAAWVYEILNTSTIAKGYKPKGRPYFEVDTSVHPLYQAPKSGKEYIGGTRGHLAAAANHTWCQEAYEDTFLISNMTSQHESLNGGIWGKLEEQCQEKIRNPLNKIRNIHVYTGPLYLPRNDPDYVRYKMMEDKAVPTHFFKVIIVEKEDDTVELKCYQMPNEGLEGATDLERYIVEIEYIESVSGLIFRESSCSQGETDSIRTVTWEGNGKVASSHVKISTPRTNNNDRADI